MSWDVLILKVPPEITDVSELPNDFHSELGPLRDILALLRSTYGEQIDLSDTTWGTMEGEEFSIEFNIGSEDPCTGIMLHVRGADSAIEPIQKLCESTGWRAMDASDCSFLHFGVDPAHGLRAWREYRDRVSPGAPLKGVKILLPVREGSSPIPQIESAPPSAKRWWQFWK